MKTYQLILATALVALSACTKEEVVNNDVNLDSNEIGFVAVTQKATKANNAIITGTTYGTDNTFKVWGWQSQNGLFSDVTADSDSNFMIGTEISWTKGATPATHSEAWRNEAHYYYWPFTGTIGFLAIHPSTVTPTTAKWDATNTKAKATIDAYTISDSNKTMDLMFAYAAGSRNSGLDVNGKLALVFKHALSQIQFRIRTNEDYSNDLTFTVNSVTINNISLVGNLAYGWGEITPAVDPDPAVMGFKFNWTGNTTQTSPWAYYATAQNAVYPTDGLDANAALYGNANVMIPQAANSDNPATTDVLEGTTLTINYTMTQTGSAAITGEVTVGAAQAWEPGKKYIYTLNFKLNEILFAPEVTDWVDVAVSTINIFD